MMKRSDLALLCCPKCYGDLTLHVTREQGDIIVEGRLHCAADNIDYPIAARIATLLPPGHKIEAGAGGSDEWS